MAPATLTLDSTTVPKAKPKGSRGGALVALYATTIFASAFLLFQVQPIISRFFLPWFGGSPAVWTTSMVFFQTVLFLAYVYAHLSVRYLPAWTQAALHSVILGAAWTTLPIAPDASWKPITDAAPTLQILKLLAATVGIPYFALAATAPLAQAWFSRSCPGRSPYRLYALSNFGSLLALISYPFFFEPRFTLGTQAYWWSLAFIAFGIICAYCAGRAYTTRQNASIAEFLRPTAARVERAIAPTWTNRFLWLALPAFASVLLLATTNHVCQDVAVIPLLWIVPLSLYLITFIISFDHDRWYWPRTTAVLAGVTMAIAAGIDSLTTAGAGIAFTFPQELCVYFAAMFFGCMLCHGELARLKPDPKYLTSFYLMISAGGALGGICVSLVAPHVFVTFFEWKLSLVCGGLLAAVVVVRNEHLKTPRWLYVAIPLTLVAFLGAQWTPALQAGGEAGALSAKRNFYGLVSVLERDHDNPAERRSQLYSGRIVHGVQYAAADRRHEPNAYFGRTAGIGRAFAALDGRPNLRVAVIGLGAGVISTYSRSGDSMTFYEINRDIADAAKKYFSFLDDCQGQVDVVLGDGRLSLERDGGPKFDLIVLDAFSGDAVPTHLLTREAMQIYLDHLKPDGVIAAQISNRYLNLEPVVRGLASCGGMEGIHILAPANPAKGEFASDWMLLTRDRALAKELARQAGVTTDSTGAAEKLWTDDYSNLFEILK